jgi:hypothetical protein
MSMQFTQDYINENFERLIKQQIAQDDEHGLIHIEDEVRDRFDIEIDEDEYDYIYNGVHYEYLDNIVEEHQEVKNYYFQVLYETLFG